VEIQEAYKQKMAAQLKEWGAKIDLLEAKAGNMAADVKVKHAEQLHELRAKQRAVSDKMKEMEKAGGEAWEQVKKTADKLWDDLKAGVTDVQSKFK
jgi:outer membrane murein-binding lipoprotein Lpp